MEATYPARHVRQIKASTAALATILADGSVVFPDAVLQSAAIAPMSNPRMFSVFKPQMQPLPCASWVMALAPCNPLAMVKHKISCDPQWLQRRLTAVPSGPTRLMKAGRWPGAQSLGFEILCTWPASGFHQPCGTNWDQMALHSLWSTDGSCDR